MSVSIIIPAHNEEKFIGSTLQAVRAGMAESTEAYEVIVVNDDSSDATSKIAVESGARVIDVKLRNIGAVRNAGAAVANGKYLVFVDADTVVPPATWTSTLNALRNGVIGGGAKVVLDDPHLIPRHKYWLFPVVAVIWQKIGGWAAGCYMFCTADAFSKSGGFPEEYFAAEEYFFSRNIKKIGPFQILNESVITSSRKLHDYSIWELFRFLTVPFMTAKGVLKSRRGLEILYEHRRNN